MRACRWCAREHGLAAGVENRGSKYSMNRQFQPCPRIVATSCRRRPVAFLSLPLPAGIGRRAFYGALRQCRLCGSTYWRRTMSAASAFLCPPALQRKCGLYGSPGGESIAPGATAPTLDEGFDSFRFVPVLPAFSGCSPLRWQLLKASRTETMNHRPFVPLFMESCT